MKQYLNIKIMETEKHEMPNFPNSSMKLIEQDILLGEAQMPWYRHDLTDTPDNAVVFPDLKTVTAISTEPGKMFLEGWVDGKIVFEMPLVVKTEKGKNDGTPSSKPGELVPVMELVFINDLTAYLSQAGGKVFSDEEPGPFQDFLIDTDDAPQMGDKLFFSSKAGCIDLKFSSNGKETVFESFENEDKLDYFIDTLNTATEIALKE